MGSNEQILKCYLSKYKYADIAKRDILSVFSQYKDLRPNHGPFSSYGGSQKELVNLDGTIPVNYSGAVYNIPIGIFILDTHPYNPPIVYVKPTNTMQIKQGPNVDANGKVDLPYLLDWRYPQSDLLGLIQILVIVFSEEPPVFSRTQGSQNTRPPLFAGGPTQTPYPSQADVGSAIRPGSNQTVTEEHLRISLLSAVEDQMKRRLREIFEQAQYKYADIAKRDIQSVFSQYKDLRPTHGPFIFNDGSQKELVNLDGTIPVNYSGAVYNIPIGIFILDTHPYNPPIVYVKPTNTMQIKEGTNVDANGKVDLPYLQDWRYPKSDLLGLIQILVIVFSEEPPVFYKAQGSKITRPPPAGGYTQTSYPSQAGGFPMPQPYASGYPSQARTRVITKKRTRIVTETIDVTTITEM